MNKVASYLQGHIAGEVFDGDAIRSTFSRDGSILAIKPSLVVYPRTTNDVRKVARFSWQLAEKGHVLSVTARGGGTDLTGAAIGKGIILSFPAHLNRILELDTKQRLVRVQPGVNFKSLQETLHTHGLFLPPFPASYEYSTIGGAIANNSGGVKSYKYGSMRSWVERLEVVLANGEIIQTGPVSKKVLTRKLGEPTLEGELYRAAAGLATENKAVFEAYLDQLRVPSDRVGYALDSIHRKNGTVDLTPLFVGSQGTLGIITEAIIKVAKYSPTSSLTVASFGSIREALEAADDIGAMKPSVLELVDGDVYEFATKHFNITFPPELSVGGVAPAALLFIECDDPSSKLKAKFNRQLHRILEDYSRQTITAKNFDELEKLWALRYATSSVLRYKSSGHSFVPVIEDAAVPRDLLGAFIEDAKALCKKHHVEALVWAHVGPSNVHILPLVDMSKVAHKQTIFKLMDEYYRMVVKIGGSIASEHGDGRLRAPFTKLQVGETLTKAYADLRKAVDPHGTMNPGVKTGSTIKDVVDNLASDYSLDRFSDVLPRM